MCGFLCPQGYHISLWRWSQPTKVYEKNSHLINHEILARKIKNCKFNYAARLCGEGTDKQTSALCSFISHVSIGNFIPLARRVDKFEFIICEMLSTTDYDSQSEPQGIGKYANCEKEPLISLTGGGFLVVVVVVFYFCNVCRCGVRSNLPSVFIM